MADGSLLELCEERVKPNFFSAQAITNFSLVGQAESWPVDRMNSAIAVTILKSWKDLFIVCVVRFPASS